jgi:hypothetical protein
MKEKKIWKIGCGWRWVEFNRNEEEIKDFKKKYEKDLPMRENARGIPRIQGIYGEMNK